MADPEAVISELNVFRRFAADHRSRALACCTMLCRGVNLHGGRGQNARAPNRVRTAATLLGVTPLGPCQATGRVVSRQACSVGWLRGERRRFEALLALSLTLAGLER